MASNHQESPELRPKGSYTDDVLSTAQISDLRPHLAAWRETPLSHTILGQQLTEEGVLFRRKLRPDQRTGNPVGPAGGQGLGRRLYPVLTQRTYGGDKGLVKASPLRSLEDAEVTEQDGPGLPRP